MCVRKAELESVCAHPGNIGLLCLIFSLFSLCVCVSLAFSSFHTSWLSIRRKKETPRPREDRFLFDPRPHYPTNPPVSLWGDGEQLRPHNEGVDNNTKNRGAFKGDCLFYIQHCCEPLFFLFSFPFYFLYYNTSSLYSVYSALCDGR
jgi:hypothetical protein